MQLRFTASAYVQMGGVTSTHSSWEGWRRFVVKMRRLKNVAILEQVENRWSGCGPVRAKLVVWTCDASSRKTRAEELHTAPWTGPAEVSVVDGNCKSRSGKWKPRILNIPSAIASRHGGQCEGAGVHCPAQESSLPRWPHSDDLWKKRSAKPAAEQRELRHWRYLTA